MQRKVIKRYGSSSDLISGILDILGEVDESAKGSKKETDHGKRKLILNDSIKEGVGDVLFAVQALVDHLYLAIDEALDLILKKYAEHFLAKEMSL